jgi:DNA-binding CsgD family transcriptional regulator
MDFGHISAVLVLDQGPEEPLFLSVSNTPKEFLDTYLDPQIGKRDPVLSKLKRVTVPFIYDQQFYVNAGAGELWENQARFGFKTGLAAVLHLPQQRHFLIGVDRPQPLPQDGPKITHLLATLQLLAAHTLEATERLMVPKLSANTRGQARPLACPGVEAGPVSLLTPRELEVLRWASSGKTAWETGRILSISENTVNKHVHSAIAKLRCVGKVHAIARALQLGLLQ